MKKTVSRVLSMLLICVMVCTGEVIQAFAGEIDLTTENAKAITEEVFEETTEEIAEEPAEEIEFVENDDSLLEEEIKIDDADLELNVDEERSIIQIEWDSSSSGINSKLKYRTDYYYLYYAVFYKKLSTDAWTCVKDMERIHTGAKDGGFWVDYLPTLNDMYIDGTIPGSGYVKIRVENGDRSSGEESESRKVDFEMLSTPTDLRWEGLYFEPYATWEPVAGADSYTVTVYAPDGTTISTYPVQEYTDDEGNKRLRAAVYSQTVQKGDYYFTVQAWNGDKTKRSFVAELDKSLRKQLYALVYEIDNMHIGNLLRESCLLNSRSSEYENPDCFYWNKNAQEITYKWNLYEEGKSYSIAQGEVTNNNSIINAPQNKKAVCVNIGKYVTKNSTPYHMVITGFDKNGTSNTKEVETDVFYSWGTSTVALGTGTTGFYPEINLQSGEIDDSGKIAQPFYYYQWQVKENGVWKNIENGANRVFNPNEEWGKDSIGKTIRIAVGTYDIYDVKYGTHVEKPHYIGLLFSDDLVITEKNIQKVDSDYLQGTLAISCYNTAVDPEVICEPRVGQRQLRVEYIKAEGESVDPAWFTYEWYIDDESTPFSKKVNTLEGATCGLSSQQLGHCVYCKVYMTDGTKKGEVVSKKIGPVLKEKSSLSVSVENAKLTETEIPVKISGQAGSCQMAITEKGTEATFSRKDLVYYDAYDVARMHPGNSEIITGFKTNTEYTIWVKDTGNGLTEAGMTSVYVTTKNHEKDVTTKGGRDFIKLGYDATSHWYICKNCGEAFGTEKHNHNGMGGLCNICGYEYNPGEFEVEIIGNPYKYTGKTIKPQIKVTAGEIVLKEKTDYTVSYKNNTNAGIGTASAVVTGKGNYSGTKEVVFTIQPISMEGMTLSEDIVSQYNAKKPTVAVNPTVTVAGKKLKKGTDYVIKACTSGSIPDASDERIDSVDGVAEATVSKNLYIQGIGNYIGNSNVFEFAITDKIPLSSLKYKKLPDQSYTGEATDVKCVNIMVGNEFLKRNGWDEDYSNYTYEYNGWNWQKDSDGAPSLGKIKGTVTAPESSDYYGKLNFEFNIVKRDLKNAFPADESGKKKNLVNMEYTGDSIELVKFNTEGYAIKDEDKINLYCPQVGGVDIEAGGPYTTHNEYVRAVEKNVVSSSQDNGYTVEYTNNVNVGTAKVLLRGINQFTGTKELTFKIVPYTYKGTAVGDDTQFKFSGLNDTYEYSPVGVCPKPIIKFNEHLLKEGVDYTLTYKNNKALGNKDDAKKAPSVTIKFKGNLKGSVTKTFTITKRDISSIDIPEYVAKYTGKMITPKFKVVLDGKTLKEGKDYKVESETVEGNLGRTNIGSYIYGSDYGYKIEGINNYENVNTKAKFTISSNGDFSGLSIDKIPDQYYTGGEIRPTIYSKKVALNTGDYTISYSNNTNVGTATATITANGSSGYNIGTKTVTFKIKGYKFSDFALNGDSKLKQFTATYGDDILEDIRNLKVTNTKAPNEAEALVKEISAPADLINDPASDTFVLNFATGAVEQAGTHNVSIQGQNKWTWLEGVKSFKIVMKPFDVTDDAKKDDSARKIKVSVSDCAYNPLGAAPEVKVKFNKGSMGTETLMEGKDYTLAYSNNKVIGSKDAAKAPTVTINFKGNFKGKRTATYNIEQRSLGNTSATAADVLLTGKAGDYKTKTITVMDSGKKLTAGKDYKVVSYSSEYDKSSPFSDDAIGTNADDIVVTLEGIGNYSGLKEVKYHLGKLNLAKCKVSSVETKDFTPGKNIELSYADIKITDPSIKDAGGNAYELKDSDYEILKYTYSGNNKIGTATVMLRGIGDYSGTLKVTFKIKAKALN